MPGSSARITCWGRQQRTATTTTRLTEWLANWGTDGIAEQQRVGQLYSGDAKNKKEVGQL